MRNTQKRQLAKPPKNLNWELSYKSKQLENKKAISQITFVSKSKEHKRLQELNIYQNNFFILVVITIVSYVFILDAFIRWNLTSGIFFSTFLIATWGMIGYQFIKLSPLPKEVYGLTLKNWQPAVISAINWSFGFILAALTLKWIVITIIPPFKGMPILSLSVFHKLGWFNCVGILISYALFVPLQELISRGILQGSLQYLLSGKYATPIAIVITSLVFSALHLIAHPIIAYTVFIPSIFWGILFAKNKSLIGVSVSHIILGIFFLYFEYLPLSDLIKF